MKRRLFALVLAFAMLAAFAPGAWAADLVNGDTYTLSADVSVTLTLVSGATATINGQGYKLTGDIVLSGDNTLTIQNLNVAGGIVVNGTGNTLILSGDNTVTQTASNKPGVQVEGEAALTIRGAGSLKAQGGAGGAGIDGGAGGSGGTIAIEGGNVTATGGNSGAGIGGGYVGSGGTIKITGGTVAATGGFIASGIGGGNVGDGGEITISGGKVTATGTDTGAGIGGGGGRSGGGIRITGGEITASGGGGGGGSGYAGGAAIGGGDHSPAGTITITPGARIVSLSPGVSEGKGDGAYIGAGGDGNGGNGANLPFVVPYAKAITETTITLGVFTLLGDTPNYDNTDVTIKYGTTTALGGAVTGTRLTGLTPDTRYYIEATAAYSGNTVTSDGLLEVTTKAAAKQDAQQTTPTTSGSSGPPIIWLPPAAQKAPEAPAPDAGTVIAAPPEAGQGPSAPPAQAARAKWYVLARKLNLRDAPDGKKTGALVRGDMIVAAGEPVQGKDQLWVPFTMNGRTVYAATGGGKYMTEMP